MSVRLGDSVAKVYLGDILISGSGAPDPLPVMGGVEILLYSDDYNASDMSWYDAVNQKTYSKSAVYPYVWNSNGGVHADITVPLPDDIFSTGFTLYCAGVFVPAPQGDRWTAWAAIWSTADGINYEEQASAYTNFNDFRTNGIFFGNTRREYTISAGGANTRECFAIRYDPSTDTAEAIRKDGTVAGSFPVVSPSEVSFELRITSNIDPATDRPQSALLALAMAYSAHNNVEVNRNLQFLKNKYNIT